MNIVGKKIVREKERILAFKKSRKSNMSKKVSGKKKTQM